LTLEHNGILEEWELHVDQELPATNEGTFDVGFLDPRENSKGYWVSDPIAVGASAGTVRDRIRGYFTSTWGSDISVTESEVDLPLPTTEEPAPTVTGVRRVYRVKLLEPIDALSFELAQVYRNETTMAASTAVSYVAPADVIRSSPPLTKDGGRYVIVCPDPQDPSNVDWNHVTSPLSIGAGAATIEHVLQTQFPHMAFKVRVTRPRGGYASDANGIKILLHMQDFDMAMPQCYLESAAEPYEIQAENPTYA
jgi:hypothetical protein